jgi:hypothetical protein
VVGDVVERFVQMGARVETVEAGGGDERINGCDVGTARNGSGEQPFSLPRGTLGPAEIR